MMKEKNPKHEPLDFDPIKMEKISEELEKDPENVELWYEKGLQHNWAGEADKAIACFSTGLIYRPFHPQMHGWRGRKLIGRDDYVGSVSELALAAALQPDDWELWYYQGVSAYLAGLYSHARKVFLEALRLMEKYDPGCIPASVDWLWMTCMRLGLRDEAKQIASRYITEGMEAVDPPYYYRGLLYNGTYEPDGFVEKCLEQEKDPARQRVNYLMLTYGLANYYHYEGRDDLAIPMLRGVAATEDCKTLFSVKQAKLDLAQMNEENSLK